MRALKPKDSQQQRRPLRQTQPRLRNWRRHVVVAAIVLAISGVAGGAAFQTGKFQNTSTRADRVMRQILHDAGFSVRSISVAGRVQTEPNELLGALNIAKDDSILHIDLVAVHDRIASLPWVQEVRVTRHLPTYLVLVGEVVRAHRVVHDVVRDGVIGVGAR